MKTAAPGAAVAGDGGTGAEAKSTSGAE